MVVVAVLAVHYYCRIDITSPLLFPESMQYGVEVWKEACVIRASKEIVRLLLPYRVWCLLRLKIGQRPILPVQDFSALG